eukprot:gene1498-1741_t
MVAFSHNKLTIITFSLLVIAWALLIAAYASYWYKIEITDVKVYVWDSATKEKVETPIGTDVGDWSTNSFRGLSVYNDRKNEKTTFRTSLAFTVIAWLVDTVALIVIGLCMFKVLKLGFFGIIVKVLLGLSLVCCIIALAVFAKVPAARFKDCAKDLGENFCNEDYILFAKFIGKDDGVKVGPSVGWPCVLVATFFTIFSLIISFFSKIVII